MTSALYYRTSELPTAEELKGTEVVEIIQGGKNVKVTVSHLGAGQGGSRVVRRNTSTDDLFFGQAAYAIDNLAIGPADARDTSKKIVIGLVAESIIVSGGGEGRIQTSGVLTGTVAQWEKATGVIGGLVPNRAYYLDKVTGRITPFAPSERGLFLTEIGTALSTTDLSIAIERPISL